MRYRMITVLLVCALVGMAQAGTITLKGPSVTQDTKLSGHMNDEKTTNYGGESSMSNLYCAQTPHTKVTRAGAFKFDLTGLGTVTSVNSATLRLYLTNANYGINTAYAAQMSEAWVEGTGTGTYSGDADGATWFTTNGGSTSTPAYDAVEGVYYVDGVSDIAVDPLDSERLFVRRAPTNSNNRQTYTSFDTLADLKAAGSGRNCFYDDATDRLWLQDSEDIRWYASGDLFAAPGGTIIGDYVEPDSMPAAAGDWLEFDVTGIVENWLIDGDSNYGFKVEAGAYKQYGIASSENETSTYHPELVIDYVPEPASMSLLALGGLTLLGKRKA